MSEIAKRIDAIIKEGLAPLLKNNGFKKKARNFYREYSDRVEVINVQASQWNEGNEGKFTINVGVYYPEISKILEAPPVSGAPKEYDCTVRERIGLLTPENKDHWWHIDGSVNDLEVAENVANQVEKICFPWLSEMSDLENVKNYVVKNKAFVAAGIALFQGYREEATDLIKKALKQKPLAKSKINSWGKKHGVVQA
ncbi:MAG: hypothetical protein AMJ53_11285 [Gammaproteobacteria bacterium SG8_11]|nr:MAG: hypothetical protein AMJ53_11285 [Gammaproteobacteria bacterium SG8_11]